MAKTQKEISHEHYIRRKISGLCPRCGRPLDRKGHYCSICAEKVRVYQYNTRQWCREHGICTECHVNHVMNGEKTCAECKIKKPYIEQKILFPKISMKKFQPTTEFGLRSDLTREKPRVYVLLAEGVRLLREGPDVQSALRKTQGFAERLLISGNYGLKTDFAISVGNRFISILNFAKIAMIRHLWLWNVQER